MTVTVIIVWIAARKNSIESLGGYLDEISGYQNDDGSLHILYNVGAAYVQEQDVSSAPSSLLNISRFAEE